MPNPHPELNGSIYFSKNDPRIWWIDGGLARLIPDENTYHGVFGSSPNKVENDLLTDITAGPEIAKGAALVRGQNEAEIYFVEQQAKRFIPTESIKKKYQLNGNVHSVPLGVLASIADGPPFA